jgi:hypothetical protein
MNGDEMRALLQKACDKAGSQSAFARKVGVGVAHVNAVLHGKPGPQMLEALGLEERTEYIPIGSKRRQRRLNKSDLFPRRRTSHRLRLTACLSNMVRTLRCRTCVMSWRNVRTVGAKAIPVR